MLTSDKNSSALSRMMEKGRCLFFFLETGFYCFYLVLLLFLKQTSVVFEPDFCGFPSEVQAFSKPFPMLSAWRFKAF